MAAEITTEAGKRLLVALVTGPWTSEQDALRLFEPAIAAIEAEAREQAWIDGYNEGYTIGERGVYAARASLLADLRFEVQAINPTMPTESFGPYDLYTPGWEDCRKAVLVLIEEKTRG